MNELKWSKTEKNLARKAFDLAYQRECETIATKLKDMILTATKPEDLWKIHDYLTEQRERTDEKYDYRYSVLISVFARLLREGWLKEAELEGLQEDKIERIKYLASM
jgi:(p)ppGpp synthase/HD superfamily hydrolase